MLLTGCIIENCRHFFTRKEKNWLFTTDFFFKKDKFSLLLLYCPFVLGVILIAGYCNGIIDLDVIRWSFSFANEAVVTIFSIRNTKLEFG